MERATLPVILVLVCAVVSVAAVVWAANTEHVVTARAVPQALRARQFELVDMAGRVRAVLGFDAAGEPLLEMRDERGNTVLLVSPKGRVEMLGP